MCIYIYIYIHTYTKGAAHYVLLGELAPHPAPPPDGRGCWRLARPSRNLGVGTLGENIEEISRPP